MSLWGRNEEDTNERLSLNFTVKEILLVTKSEGSLSQPLPAKAA